jgi:hypothetical protein
LKLWQIGACIGLAWFHRHGILMSGRAIGPAMFRAYMLLAHP